jgi:hypothetical protein
MNCANHPETTASAFCRECGKPMCQECQRPALGSIYCAEHLPVAAPMPAAAPASFVPPPPPPAPPPSAFRETTREATGETTGEKSYAGSPYSAPAAAPYSGAAPPQYAASQTPLPVYETGAHPVLALILGFIPGVGAIYNGQYAKGLIHAVVFGLLVSIVSNMHGSFEPLFGLLIGAWVFYMAFEAYHTARKRRYGVSVEEFSSLFDVRPTQGRFPAGAILLIGLGFLLLLDTTDMISMDQMERYWPVGLIVFGLYMLYARLSPEAQHGVHHNDSRADRNAEAPK